MASKSSPSIIPRFTGIVGRNNLLAALCAQHAVAGDRDLARRLIAAGELREFKAKKAIMKQGDADDTMYLIISGSVAIIINKREMAIRSAGTHVGEMALLDPTARRSASVVTKEHTTLLILRQKALTSIANHYPEFYRRLAVELGVRLRERSQHIREPNPVPTVFIGSSAEALSEATCLCRSLERRNLACRLWTQGVFQLTRTTIEDLTKTAHECDFAVLFMTPDDVTASRGRRISSPRDNIVFELGLFMGVIGRDRTYIAAQKGIDLKLPTDLLGVSVALYAPHRRRPPGQRLRALSRALWKRIQELGPK